MSFLNALKEKSAIEIAKQVSYSKPHDNNGFNNPPIITPTVTATSSDQSVIDWLDPNGKLQDAGLLQHAPMQNYESKQLTVTIDRVLNRHRLDVFFNQKPSEEILKSLRAHDFHYRPSDKAWYNKDTETNRIFLEYAFGAHFVDSSDVEDSKSYEVSDNSILDNVVVPENSVTLTSVNNEKDLEVSPQFAKFRSQTNELLEHLKCEPADLMLIAIDALHKQTFSRDS